MQIYLEALLTEGMDLVRCWPVRTYPVVRGNEPPDAALRTHTGAHQPACTNTEAAAGGDGPPKHAPRLRQQRAQLVTTEARHRESPTLAQANRRLTLQRERETAAANRAVTQLSNDRKRKAASTAAAHLNIYGPGRPLIRQHTPLA